MHINQEILSSTKKMDLLVAGYIACVVISELMGGKTFSLAFLGLPKLSASVAIFVFPLLFTMNDVILEVFGPERARSVVRSGLAVVAFLFLFSLLAVSIPPSARFLATEPAYDTIFGQSIRISFASLVAFAVAESADLFVFVHIRARLGKKALWFRNNVSNMISQFFDTTLFMTLAFYAWPLSFAHNVQFLFGLILPYWILKCSMSVIETPLVYLGVKWLRSDA